MQYTNFWAITISAHIYDRPKITNFTCKVTFYTQWYVTTKSFFLCSKSFAKLPFSLRQLAKNQLRDLKGFSELEQLGIHSSTLDWAKFGKVVSFCLDFPKSCVWILDAQIRKKFLKIDYAIRSDRAFLW